jgi:hypothetical protein
MRELRYRTDFNNVRKDGLLTALLGFSGSIQPPVPGERIGLFDADGNSCTAFAVKFENDLVYAEPDWSTWSPAVQVDAPGVDLMEALRASVEAASSRPDVRVGAGHEDEQVTGGDDTIVFDIKHPA